MCQKNVPAKNCAYSGFTFLSIVTFISPSSPSLRTVPSRRSPSERVKARCCSSFKATSRAIITPRSTSSSRISCLCESCSSPCASTLSSAPIFGFRSIAFSAISLSPLRRMCDLRCQPRMSSVLTRADGAACGGFVAARGYLGRFNNMSGGRCHHDFSSAGLDLLPNPFQVLG